MERTTADYAEKFGKRLSDIMYERHITQAQLSQELGVPKGTIYNWTHGLRLPRAAAMDALCRHLQVSRSDLLDEPQEPITDTPQTVQEPARELGDDALGLVLDALEAAGYGHLRDLVQAAAGADDKSLAFVTGILQRNQK